ncbi:hypothetical protein B0T25DRAFT_633246 [Lasiosphaeria hispida]|uniref:Beta-lactamase-related domain-containing protein n=1 Tax=Lasiosphaeria hispida TaxID=260671 RepID=A0AAJ0HFP3_9PEZI|nr:hypothetical protein B0T25DRAFT_633246 [Lasiosphaeria hispida]
MVTSSGAVLAGILGGALLAPASLGAPAVQKPVVDNGRIGAHHDGSAAGGAPFTPEFTKFALETLEKWHVPGMSIAVIDGNDVHLEQQLFHLHHPTNAPELAHAHRPHPPGRRLGHGPPDARGRGDAPHGAAAPRQVEPARRRRPRHGPAAQRHLRDITLAKKTLGDVMWELLWKPLGMSATYFGVDEVREAGLVASEGKLKERLARGYYWDDVIDSYKELEPVPQAELGGAGLIVSSARDYARWVKSQLEESGPLSRAAHAALREPKMTEGPGRGAWDSPPNYASGWDVQTVAKFKHVSGEYWVMDSRLIQAPNSWVLAGFADAEFKVGVDGKVNQLGVEWRDTLSGIVDG